VKKNASLPFYSRDGETVSVTGFWRARQLILLARRHSATNSLRTSGRASTERRAATARVSWYRLSPAAETVTAAYAWRTRRGSIKAGGTSGVAEGGRAPFRTAPHVNTYSIQAGGWLRAQVERNAPPCFHLLKAVAAAGVQRRFCAFIRERAWRHRLQAADRVATRAHRGKTCNWASTTKSTNGVLMAAPAAVAVSVCHPVAYPSA
jgi:hypothetical protein